VSLLRELSESSTSLIGNIHGDIRDICSTTESVDESLNQLQRTMERCRIEMQQRTEPSASPAVLGNIVKNAVESAVENVLAKQITHQSVKDELVVAVKPRNGEVDDILVYHSSQQKCIAESPPRQQNDAGSSRILRPTRHSNIYHIPFFDIGYNTFVEGLLDDEKSNNSNDETEEQVHLVSTIEVRFILGYWRKGINASARKSCARYSIGLDLRLSTLNIVADDSPIISACCNFDLLEVQRLFNSHAASPFDQNSHGYSLFDLTFYEMCHQTFEGKDMRGVELLQFLVRCGGGPLSLAHTFSPNKKSWIQEILIAELRSSYQGNFANASRLIIQHSIEDPLSHWDPGLHVTFGFQRHALGQALLQQNQWMVDLQPHGSTWFQENDRHIIDDPDATFMRAAIETMAYSAINPIEHGGCTTTGLHSIFFLYHHSPYKIELYNGCKNRLVALLDAGYDPEKPEIVPYLESRRHGRMLSVTECALYANTFDIWKDALSNAGWSDTGIQGLVDEVQYQGISSLFGNGLVYSSLSENRDRFLQKLSTGYFTDISQDEYQLEVISEELTPELNMNCYDIRETIREASLAFFATSIPGTWPEEGPVKLVFGEDFYLYQYRKARHLVSFEEYDTWQANDSAH
jgi:hypothetical protein